MLLIIRTLDPFDQTSALQIFQRRGHVGFRRLTDLNDLSRIFILNFSFFVTIYGGVIRLLTILTVDKYDKRRKVTVQI